MEIKNFFSQHLAGQVIANPQVFVYLPNSQTLAGGLQTAAGGTLGNPFTGTSTGLIQFAAPDGRYDLRVVGEGRDFRIPIQCLDVTSGVAAVSVFAGIAQTQSASSAASAASSAATSLTAAANSASSASVSASSAASAATSAASAATSAGSASSSAATSASQANAVLTAASPLRISQNSTTTNGSGGNTGDLTLVSLNIPSNYPILGDSFSIEAFGLQQQASTANAITVEVLNGSGTVLASTSIQAGGTTQAAPGRGFVHLRTYDQQTQVANVACGLDLGVSGLPTSTNALVTNGISIAQLSLRIRSSQGSPSQIINGLIATITEVRPFFSGTLG